MITAARRFELKPGEPVLVRATVFPRGVLHGDAGDHLQIEVKGGATFYAPISEIFDAPGDVIAELCGEHGRAIRAA